MRTQHALHTLQAFPVYSLGFVKNDKLLLGGGGGATRSGIKNKLRLYDVDETGAKLELLNELELEKDEDAPMSMAIDHGKELGGLPGLSLSPASVGPTGLQLMQKVTALSKDGTLLAAGSSDGKPFNQVTLVSYPKLDLASEPFTIPSGELFDADFSTDGYLIVTSTTNLYVFSPSSAPSKMSPSTAHPQLNLVNTIPVPASHPNSSYRSTRWSPHDSKTAWSIINNTNGSSKDRRGWVARWSITGLGEGEKSQGKGEWKVARIAKVATRPITVFDVSQDGKLLAFGSSDLSVGILDSQKLVPLLTILRAHEFPPTALRFNPSGSLLASASADNTLRLIAVPSSFGQSAMTTILILFVLLVGLLAVLIQRGDIIW
ncbi:WD40 repeats protein [Rhizoctonia solani]|uniref:WD40 repeats protein n=1 Tax=Rhizoctonia solani TaxID=456999 RepID=A0A8H7IMW9_9AGAM|nr:WD40 repeats protein [Rhizoctonia solani]